MKLTDSQMQRVIEKTGATKEYIESIVSRIPAERIQKWWPGFYVAALIAAVRCATCIGPARKIAWCALLIYLGDQSQQ